MKKPQQQRTNFQQDMAAEQAIKDARARGRAAMGKATLDKKSDELYREKNKLEEPHAARNRERAKVGGPLQDRTGWEAIEIGISSAK